MILPAIISPRQSFYNIHFPSDYDSLEKARFRLKYEELFFNQLKFKLTHNKIKNANSGYFFPSVGSKFNKFYNENLVFELTNSQKRVIKEIRNDFSSKKQMIRLLQGDVGSGKTIVALMSILISLDNGYQACLLSLIHI